MIVFLLCLPRYNTVIRQDGDYNRGTYAYAGLEKAPPRKHLSPQQSVTT